MRVPATLFILAVAAVAAGQCLDYEATWADWTHYRPAEPTTRVAVDVRAWGDSHLLVNHGNGLVLYGFPASGIPRATAAASFACAGRPCPLQIPADWDYITSRFSAPAGGHYGLMYSMAGTVIFGMPGFNSATAFTSATVGGGFSFVRGGDQYAVLSDWPGLCGAGTRNMKPALIRLTSTSTWEHLQCLGGGSAAGSMPTLAPVAAPAVLPGAYAELATVALAATGAAYVVDGVDLGSHVYMIERYGATQSYQVTGAGSSLRLSYAGPAPRMVSMWGRSWALDGDLLLTDLPPTAPDQAGLWDVSSPGSPVFLAELPVPYQGRVALGEGFAAVFDLDTFAAYDVREPSAPVLIAEGEVPELPSDAPPWDYRYSDGTAGQFHMGGLVRGGRLYLADSVAGLSLVIDLAGCTKPAAIFSDGFESGGTSGWSVTAQVSARDEWLALRPAP